MLKKGSNARKSNMAAISDGAFVHGERLLRFSFLTLDDSIGPLAVF